MVPPLAVNFSASVKMQYQHSGWVEKRIVDRQPPGFAYFYPDERVVVLNLSTVIPPELSLEVREIRCENGEIRVAFGPSRLRLDRLVASLDADPFDLE